VQRAVRIAEQYADGNASAENLCHAVEEVRRVANNGQRGPYHEAQTAKEIAIDFVFWLVSVALDLEPNRQIWREDLVHWGLNMPYGGAVEIHIGEDDLLRDVFANPGRPIDFDPRWLTSTVVDLARAIHDERAFENLPILGDALMDSGCDNEEIIAHCRSKRPHFRGCWPVDLILGKS
jgi:hypothetical protein